jgi:hypothetical protein
MQLEAVRNCHACDSMGVVVLKARGSGHMYRVVCGLKCKHAPKMVWEATNLQARKNWNKVNRRAVLVRERKLAAAIDRQLVAIKDEYEPETAA